MAIDFGLKRSGLAVTDPLQIIAGGLTTVETGRLTAFIVDYVSKEPTELLVVGLPTKLNGEPSEMLKHIELFVGNIRRAIPDMPICYADERFTSVIAHRTILDAGLSKQKRRDKALVDEVSAVIILQSYMESKKNT
jgi:putative Holliday junction resolvase